ncbi:hypothetical protein PGTUg99_026087 [Puccinia graminis f. sp. tritici]|uniref:Uncharacterized protein n=1 Tax=Puccinia graminis f. sp. tritici TaxID=56615 RepID=A0A5B0P4F1_PUCGR|nr:hypothetical protein PGTUg99_026087 [Puccinia graminis f. sp. tritici]
MSEMYGLVDFEAAFVNSSKFLRKLRKKIRNHFEVFCSEVIPKVFWLEEPIFRNNFEPCFGFSNWFETMSVVVRSFFRLEKPHRSLLNSSYLLPSHLVQSSPRLVSVIHSSVDTLLPPDRILGQLVAHHHHHHHSFETLLKPFRSRTSELISKPQSFVITSKRFRKNNGRSSEDLWNPFRITLRNVPGPRSRTSAPAGAYFETFPNELRKCFEPLHP